MLGLALAEVGGFTYVLTTRFRELAAHVSEYSTSIRRKLASGSRETMRYFVAWLLGVPGIVVLGRFLVAHAH
jgi:hypothetical protein